MVLRYQSAEIPVTPKAGRNALLGSDCLLKLTLLTLHSASCHTLLEAPSDQNSFCWCSAVRHGISEVGKWICLSCVSEQISGESEHVRVRVGASMSELWEWACPSSKSMSNSWIYCIIHKWQYIIHALQLHYSNNSVMLSVNCRCIIEGYPKQCWGVLHYLVLLVLWEVMVGHIACGRLHITQYVFPDMPQQCDCSLERWRRGMFPSPTEEVAMVKTPSRCCFQCVRGRETLTSPRLTLC